MTPVPDFVAGARALLAASSDCTIDGAPAVVVPIAELNDLVARVHEAEAERGRSDEAARRFLEQRQELAAERYAWQERGDRAEAELAQVQAELGQMRETNKRLNKRCQQAESKLVTYERAVGEWELSERGTYVPLRTLTAIAKAAGREFDAGRFELHYQRVERAEAERDKALKAFNAVTLELWDAQSDRDIAESARAQAEKRVGIVERLNRNQADTIARVRDLTGRWAKRTDQLKRAAELIDDALAGPEADRA